MRFRLTDTSAAVTVETFFVCLAVVFGRSVPATVFNHLGVMRWRRF